MNLLRKTATTLGGIFLAVLLITALAPKATRGVAAALVQVTNTSANPVPVTSNDNPANFPFGASLCAQFSHVGCGPGSDVLVVPLTTSTGLAVKRLVLEDVEMDCPQDTGVSSVLGLISVPFPADNVQSSLAKLQYAIFTTPVGPSFAFADSPVRIYADPGAELATIATGASVTPGTGATCFFSLTGHLETK